MSSAGNKGWSRHTEIHLLALYRPLRKTLGMANKLHVDDAPWNVMNPRVKQTTKKVVAAIAYIGSAAPYILRLGRGHVLVCDASEVAISQGSTSATALQQYRDRGVRIYSYPGLHAKVVVLSRTAFIGSANVSMNSWEHLNEAVIETTDAGLVSQARSFVEGMATESSRLSKLDIAKLGEIKVVRSPTGPRKAANLLTVPSEVPRLWLASMVPDELTASEAKVIDREKTKVRSEVRHDGVTAGVRALAFDPESLKEMSLGDWLLAVYENGRVFQPVQLRKISIVSKNQRIAWVTVPKSGSKSIQDDHYFERLKFDWEEEDQRLVTGKATRSILKPFLG